MKHDPIDPNHYPKLHAYLKTLAMLPWADKLAHISNLIREDEYDKEATEEKRNMRELSIGHEEDTLNPHPLTKKYHS